MSHPAGTLHQLPSSSRPNNDRRRGITVVRRCTPTRRHRSRPAPRHALKRSARRAVELAQFETTGLSSGAASAGVTASRTRTGSQQLGGRAASSRSALPAARPTRELSDRRRRPATAFSMSRGRNRLSISSSTASSSIPFATSSTTIGYVRTRSSPQVGRCSASQHGCSREDPDASFEPIAATVLGRGHEIRPRGRLL